MTCIKGRFFVEDWDTCETIAEFQTEEKRQAWLDKYVDEYGFMKDGTRVSIYEIY